MSQNVEIESAEQVPVHPKQQPPDAHRVLDLGFRIEGLGFRVQGLGFLRLQCHPAYSSIPRGEQSPQNCTGEIIKEFKYKLIN